MASITRRASASEYAPRGFSKPIPPAASPKALRHFRMEAISRSDGSIMATSLPKRMASAQLP